MMAPVTCLTLTSTDTFLLVSCADETLRVFSLCLARELHELRGHQANVCFKGFLHAFCVYIILSIQISSMVISSDDCQVFAGSSDGSIYCYDLHNGHMMATQKCSTAAISSLKVFPIDSHIYLFRNLRGFTDDKEWQFSDFFLW